MTNKEAIHCMKSYLPEDTYETCVNCKYYGEECKSSEAHNMAIKALEEQQWIPCSERLPEKETHWYLVCSPHGQIKVDWWHCNDGRWDWRYMFEPIAWMPLPEPYKEGE